MFFKGQSPILVLKISKITIIAKYSKNLGSNFGNENQGNNKHRKIYTKI